jgi:hypothetical protein
MLRTEEGECRPDNASWPVEVHTEIRYAGFVIRSHLRIAVLAIAALAVRSQTVPTSNTAQTERCIRSSGVILPGAEEPVFR